MMLCIFTKIKNLNGEKGLKGSTGAPKSKETRKQHLVCKYRFCSQGLLVYVIFSLVFNNCFK